MNYNDFDVEHFAQIRTINIIRKQYCYDFHFHIDVFDDDLMNSI